MTSYALGVLALVTAAALCRAQKTPNAGGAPSPGSYSGWMNGPSADPGYFPVAVWLQDPQRAPQFRKAGINMYVGLWQGPTEEQLAALKGSGMRVVCEQNEVGLKHRDDPTIAAWMHGDEPDNAQPLPGGKGYGPPVPAAKVIADYGRMKAADPTRPVLLNLGQGVANDEWKGRGPHPEDYREYCKGADIVSFDVYPVVGIDKPDGENYLWYVPRGLDRLKEWSGGRKLLWNALECTHVGEAEKKATPAQVKAEVWMSLVHGSRGIVYFIHQFKPRFVEAALLEDPEMLAAVTALNAQVRELAPVLNSPTVPDAVTVTSTEASVPIDLMVKRHGGATYLFAVGMRNGATRGEFALKDARKARRATVIGEDRTLDLKDGRFQDGFSPYAVHLYRIEDTR
jgi:hypothetical protein